MSDLIKAHDDCHHFRKIMLPTEKFDLDQILTEAQTSTGKARALREISKSGVPVYGSDPNDPSVLIETSPNGDRRRGTFINGHFVALQ
ncbi:hypothetical protein [Nibricoccus aquaticus]|uniref:hypothetical protein n=1 Tax=Nibricoccus aquaticus TaxID=2576891 RepID=UPI0010FD9DBE|nr:hypothetical protein [Nibricoccus aquaticus]